MQTVGNRNRIGTMESNNITNPNRGYRGSFVTKVSDKGEVYLRLSRKVLRTMGLHAVRVVEGLERQSAGQLLLSLSGESGAGHTWRRFVAGKHLDAGTLVDLVESQLLKGRPTTCFTYIGETSSGEDVAVGFAAISAKVSVEFPFAGYPVLARAFIHPNFRGFGLYRHIVAHRVEACEQTFGTELMAIHMGAAVPAVSSVQRSRIGYLEPFVKIGCEVLDLGEQKVDVVDLLAVSPRFMAELTDSLGDNVALCDGIVSWLRGGPGAWGWGRVLGEIRGSLGDEDSQDIPLRLRQLVALTKAIGVVEDR